MTLKKTDALPWRSVWITGAGRGIGRALTMLLAEHGVNVYASSRTAAELETLASDYQHLPGEIIPIILDITCTEQVVELIDGWDQSAFFPELVILNAGNHDPFSADQFSARRCKKLFDVNLQGTVNCLEPALLRMLKQDQGHIAVMASVAGYRGLPTAAAYGASKAALIHLCESLRLDLKDTHVKLQVINPGFVKTPLTDKNEFTMPALLTADDAAQRILKGLLSQRFEITFPKRFTFILKLLRMLPYPVYFYVVGKLVK
ncbi:MAG: oxidoreductase [Neptuniibacter sp. Phe_28]|nr:MAG: oxidoreductase [Neptuniibacter sp. Phe_28]